MNPSVDAGKFNAAPTIAEFVSTHDLKDVVIGCAVGSTGERHTFAVDGRSFYDNNTGGVVVDAGGIHPLVRDLKVVEIFRVRRR